MDILNLILQMWANSKTTFTSFTSDHKVFLQNLDVGKIKAGKLELEENKTNPTGLWL